MLSPFFCQKKPVFIFHRTIVPFIFGIGTYPMPCNIVRATNSNTTFNNKESRKWKKNFNRFKTSKQPNQWIGSNALRDCALSNFFQINGSLCSQFGIDKSTQCLIWLLKFVWFGYVVDFVSVFYISLFNIHFSIENDYWIKIIFGIFYTRQTPIELSHSRNFNQFPMKKLAEYRVFIFN